VTYGTRKRLAATASAGRIEIQNYLRDRLLQPIDKVSREWLAAVAIGLAVIVVAAAMAG
jgi:hypothetical protein